MTTNPNFGSIKTFTTTTRLAARIVGAASILAVGATIAFTVPTRASAAENSSPATIEMNCSYSAPTHAVRCTSATVTPQGWASWMLLRGDGIRGRAFPSAPDHTLISASLVAVADPAYPVGIDKTSHTFVDPTVKPGITYTYVLWAVDGTGKPFAHSALSTVAVPTGATASEPTPSTTAVPPTTVVARPTRTGSEPTTTLAARK